MKRSDIKVGETYAVTLVEDRSRRYSWHKRLKGTVMNLDARRVVEYTEHRPVWDSRTGKYGSVSETKKKKIETGILVKLDKPVTVRDPVVISKHSYRDDLELPKSKHREYETDEVILKSGFCFHELWADKEADEAREREYKERQRLERLRLDEEALNGSERLAEMVNRAVYKMVLLLGANPSPLVTIKASYAAQYRYREEDTDLTVDKLDLLRLSDGVRVAKVALSYREVENRFYLSDAIVSMDVASFIEFDQA